MNVCLESVVLLDPKIDLVGWWIKVIHSTLVKVNSLKKMNAQ